jgi:hypothetical protein
MNTTISISVETRDRIKGFGSKGESYNEILRKLLDHTQLMNTMDSITLKEARARLNK